MRISIIGYSGSGKSTLAKKLNQTLNVPLLYLDTVRFMAGWKERPENECIEMVAEFLENKSWIIDGNYRRWFHERRLEESDWIIFLNFSRIKSFLGAIKRYLKYRNKSRESMTYGCNEKLDFEFISWLLWTGRKKERRQRFVNICKKYSEKTVICKSRKDVNKFLEKFKLDYSESLKL